MGDLEEGDQHGQDTALGPGLAAEARRGSIDTLVGDILEEADIAPEGPVIKTGAILWRMRCRVRICRRSASSMRLRLAAMAALSSRTSALRVSSMARNTLAVMASISTCTSMNQCSS
jgi:hypothetical protein